MRVYYKELREQLGQWGAYGIYQPVTQFLLLMGVIIVPTQSF